MLTASYITICTLQSYFTGLDIYILVEKGAIVSFQCLE